MNVVFGNLYECLKVVFQIELKVVTQVARQEAAFDPGIIRKDNLVPFGIAGEGSGILVQELRQAAVRKLSGHPRTGPKNHLEAELTGQFKENYQVLTGIGHTAKVHESGIILMDIPRYCGRYYSESGPLNPLETDRPVAFVDSKVVQFCGEWLVCFFTDRELVADNS
jgi:hypothetical protein